ncbi:hypothetical protein ANCCAN_14357 [Ancylostoma caninum]|uniref:G-protein coupled receptors family 1 profile domain-containing protein n=1 Tax=Ancylostoma caninum TaxID=29170 RepID=A0A368G5L6_ANCCA|nr:hypothetical protein ANCCAN_14357 [Ancylostoma caninum]
MSVDLDNPLIFCNACLGSTDPDYQTYNLAVSGVVLAIVGVIGLIGNILVVSVYTHDDHWKHSTSIYLAALAFSDFFLILTAMFLFVLEAWRHHNHPRELGFLFLLLYVLCVCDPWRSSVLSKKMSSVAGRSNNCGVFEPTLSELCFE